MSKWQKERLIECLLILVMFQGFIAALYFGA
jgi:hypothetical protein